ncbi:MAG: alginate export family protein [Armatimonadetes bacterium]|nr:alginate export family protein [Armatimonadota bacterium]
MPVLLPVAFLNSPPRSDLHVSGEYRVRFERRTDKDFKRSSRDNGSNLLQRARVTLDWRASESITGTVQYQYAHNTFWKNAGNGSDENSQISQLYLRSNEQGTQWTIGRQKVSFGTERLLVSSDWGNVGRTYDAIRFQRGNWDAIALKVGAADPVPANARLVAVAHTHHQGVTSLYYKGDRDSSGETRIYTLDHAVKTRLGAGEFEAEAAGQMGRNRGMDHTAWAYHLAYNQPIGKRLKTTIELNGASGGPASASKSHTFDTLYTSSHKFFGMTEMFSWRNLTETMLTLSYNASDAVDLKTRYIAAWLQHPKDAWYGGNGRPNTSGGTALVDATGMSGRSLGNVIDFEASWKRNTKEVLSAGMALFQPGTFVRNRTGDNRAQLYGYMQYFVRF